MSTAIRKDERRTEIVEVTDSPLHAELLSAESFLNREFSLLEFHRRVLEEAFDEHNPLLERLKFLTLGAMSLDKVCLVEAYGLKEEVEQNGTELAGDGFPPAEQLTEIRERLLPIIAQQTKCLRESI